MRTITITTFNYTHIQSFAGFFTYWKLFFKLIHQISMNSLFSKTEKSLLLLNLILLKSIWYLFIKPFGFIFSYKKEYIGKKNFNSVEGKKEVTGYLFKIIPFFFYRAKRFSKKDLEYIQNR